MAEGGLEARRIVRAVLALALSAGAAPLFAQTPAKQSPPPPQPETTTIVEKPDDKPKTETTAPAPETKAPERVPPDASGFHLSKLETKDLTLLYLDPLQTY